MSKKGKNEGDADKTRRTDASQPALTPLERKAAERRARYQKKRRIIRTGQVLMAAGALMALIHLLAHWGAFSGQPSNLVDLVAGYPAAVLIVFVGAVAAGQRQ